MISSNFSSVCISVSKLWDYNPLLPVSGFMVHYYIGMVFSAIILTPSCLSCFRAAIWILNFLYSRCASKRKGMKNIDLQVTECCITILAVAFARLQHGIKKNISSAAYLT
jgi:hypothetical protein